jgi:haloacetate dehalogenase
MNDAGDFFPGFAERKIAVGDVTLHARIGGAGPPLVLLHGYPQSHVMWRRVAPKLAERFTTVVPDLRGYGRSSVPASRKGEGYSKLVMGADIVALMEALGHPRFSLAGHDRGGRVGYRLAFDRPERIEKLAVLDIVPTGEMWRGMNAARAMSVYHWMFLAQPEPLPEMLIAGAPRDYIDQTLASWTATKSLDCFGEAALESYRAAFADPKRIHAFCEDYRAGATIDREADEDDFAAGRKIAPALLALWGEAGIPAAGANPLDVWRRWASDVRGQGIRGGHFLPEEAPEATATALLGFLIS